MSGCSFAPRLARRSIATETPQTQGSVAERAQSNPSQATTTMTEAAAAALRSFVDFSFSKEKKTRRCQILRIFAALAEDTGICLQGQVATEAAEIRTWRKVACEFATRRAN